MEEVVPYIIFIAAIWGFTISSILFITNRNRKANRILAAFLFFLAWGLLWAYFEALGLQHRVPHLLWLTFPHMFVFGPLLYLYCRVLTRNARIVGAATAWHMAPFVLASIYFCIFYFFVPGSEKLVRLRQIQTNGPPLDFTMLRILGRISGITYSVLSLREVRSYTKRIKGYFSNIHQVNLGWLQMLLLMVLCAWSLSTTSFAIEFFSASRLAVVDTATNIIAFLLLYIMSYLTIQQPDLYNWVDHLNAEKVLSEERREPKQREQRSLNLNDDSLERYQQQIYRLMDQEKPYLDSLLTIKKLSAISRVPVNVLSYIINTDTGNNFYYFINRYRIDHAAGLLRAESEAATRILDIAYASGFNSKSVFNTMFRKFKGATPREYRTRGSAR